jgi:hypothetical protein
MSDVDLVGPRVGNFLERNHALRQEMTVWMLRKFNGRNGTPVK